MRWTIIILIAVLLSSCAEKFNYTDENRGCALSSEVVSVRALRDLCFNNSIIITDDIAVSGRVVANDVGGNYYQCFAVECPDGGVEVMAGFGPVNVGYPIGRNLHIKLKGTQIALENGVIRIGLPNDQGRNPVEFRSPALLNDFVCRDYSLSEVSPHTVMGTELNNSMLGRLVCITDLVGTSELVWGASSPVKFMTKGGVSVCVSVSSYSSLSGKRVPNGAFSATGVLYKMEIDGLEEYVIKPRTRNDIE